MKMVIAVGLLITGAAGIIIFVLALIGMAAAKATWEQMLDDEEQDRYIRKWMELKKKRRKNHRSGRTNG